MLRADRPFTVPVPAVYFFTGIPTRVEKRINVSQRVRSNEVINLAVVDSSILCRWDGCVAILGSDRCPARVSAGSTLR